MVLKGVTSVHGSCCFKRPTYANSSGDIRGGQTQLYHVEDVLPRCRHVMKIVQTDIDRGIFSDGSDVKHVIDAIMTETQRALIYQRQRRRTGELMTEEVDER